MPEADAAIVIGLIELAGALLIVGHCVSALVLLITTGDPVRVRLMVIEGALWGLNLKTAASLLKTIEVQNWTQIAAFTVILSLRTVLKRVMMWEQGRLRLRKRTSPQAAWRIQETVGRFRTILDLRAGHL